MAAPAASRVPRPSPTGAGEAEPEPRGAHREFPRDDRPAEHFEVAVEDRVRDRRLLALGRQGVEPGRHRLGAPGHRCGVHEADRARALARQHANQVGVAHRIERVILERALVQRHRADEQVALVDAAARLREGRGDQRDGLAGRIPQGVHDRADIAGVGRIEGRAHLKHHVRGAAGPQPAFSLAGPRHGLVGRDRAALQRHHDRVGLRKGAVILRYPDGLDRAQARLGQGVGEVRSARVVVGDASQRKAHRILPL
jgi:hypothetical protein